MARNVARNSAQRPGSHGERVVRGFEAGRKFSSIKRKFRVAFGSGLVGWAPVPEELIEGSAGAVMPCDQRFDGGDCLVGVHVELLALQPHGSCLRLTFGRNVFR